VYRHIPSSLTSALVFVAVIYGFIRFLTPATFNIYAYVFSTALVLLISCFCALSAVMRFYSHVTLTGWPDNRRKQTGVAATCPLCGQTGLSIALCGITTALHASGSRCAVGTLDPNERVQRLTYAWALAVETEVAA
jgi:hypothetical protein